MRAMGARRAIVWLTPGQVPLAREGARAAELRVIGAGSPERGRSTAVAADLAGADGASLDDLRATIAGADADVFWILSPGGFGSGGEDAAALLAAHERGARVVSLEPMPALATDLGSRAWTDGLVRAVDIPAIAPDWPGPPQEVLASVGPARTVALEWWSTPEEGTLAARLFGAMELVLRLMGEPESVDAAYAGPEQGRAVHALPGESLRGLRGDLTANLRFSEGRAGTLALSDRGGAWSRSVSLLGPGGRVRVRDEVLEWIGMDGAPVEEAGKEARRGSRKGRRVAEDAAEEGSGANSGAIRLISRGLARALSDRAGGPPRDTRTVLAMCHAALLSARTGQCESPATIKRIAGVA